MNLAVGQLASGLSWSNFSKAQDLQARIWFTLGALLVYRFGAYIPVPGVDPTALAHIFQDNAGGLLGLFNVFSGGAVGRMAVFALGIVPYISASIVVQLLSSLVPYLARLKKEGSQGRRTLNQYTRYLTVILAFFQGYGVAVTLELTKGLVPVPGYAFELSTTLTLVSGTAFLTWLGEQMTSRGIGNGTSLIIFAGIITQFPSAAISILELGRQGAFPAHMVILFFGAVIGIIALVVFVERAQRRLLIQYPKRHPVPSSADRSHMPIKINVSGVIPPVFASSLLMVPATFSHLFSLKGADQMWITWFITFLTRGNILYFLCYMAGIIFFSFFYMSIVFEPSDVADNIKKGGGFIPGIRPGKMTADYLEGILTRLTVLGSAYLVSVCLIPEVLITHYGLPIALGGTSLLIVVSVIMDTLAQIQGYMMAQQYEGLIRKAKFKRSHH